MMKTYSYLNYLAKLSGWLLLFVGLLVFTQIAHGQTLRIEPEGGTYPINSVQQFRAFYNDQDVTNQASWNISGSFTNSPKRGELISPGQFRLLLGGDDVYIRAQYQGESAGTRLTVQGGSAYGRTAFTPLDQNINVGDSIQLKYFRGEQVFCQNPPCTGRTEEVSGQWFTTTSNVLENLGGGLFRAKAEGYGIARITPFDGVPSSAQTYVGVVDPNKPINTSFDVSLVKRQPVYTWIDAKYHDSGGYGPFTNIDFIPTSSGGRFAVVGECADGRDVGISGIASGHQVELEDGGLYVLSENGQFVAQGDVCHDTMVPTGCYEIGGCGIGKDLFPIDSGRFLIDTGEAPGRGHLRSPLLYDIGGNSVSRENRLFFTNSIPSNERASSVEELVEFRYIAHANGVMVGVGLESTGTTHPRISGFPGPTIPFERKNMFFSVPEFQELGDLKTPTTCSSRSCSGSPYVTQPVYTPMFGLGEYFVAVEKSTATGPYNVYRMPSRQELRDGVRPEKVQELDLSFTGIRAFTYDASDSNRIIVVGHSSSQSTPYVIYEPGEEGLVEVDSGTLGTGTITGYNVALSGDYIAYSSCAIKSGAHPLLGIANLGSCELIVEHAGEKLSVEPLPLNIFSPRSYGGMPGVAISPSGRILVSAHNAVGAYGENDNLYLYQINDVTGIPSTPNTTPSIPTNFNLQALMEQYGITPPQGGFNYQGTAQNYASQYADIYGTSNTLNTQSQQTTTQYTLPRPPQTIAEIRQFQCAYGIVCSGSTETTGYGNLGPQTRAKIQEVFEQGSVNGTHTIQTQSREELQARINSLIAQVQVLLERLDEVKISQ